MTSQDQQTSIPGHALHEKGLQRQKSLGPLVSNQEERALLLPVINRGSTADFVPAFGLHRISLVRASGEAFKGRVFDALEGTRNSRPLGDQFCWHPVVPDIAPPSVGRPDPNRSWYVPVSDSTSTNDRVDRSVIDSLLDGEQLPMHSQAATVAHYYRSLSNQTGRYEAILNLD